MLYLAPSRHLPEADADPCSEAARCNTFPIGRYQASLSFTYALPHRVARQNTLVRTEAEPKCLRPIVRARPCSVFGRPVHLSGLLPLITTRWFSSSLSDPASRQAPCPPENCQWWLHVGLSVSRLSPTGAMDRFVTRENIERYRKLASELTDFAERSRIMKSLADEVGEVQIGTEAQRRYSLRTITRQSRIGPSDRRGAAKW